MTLAEFLNDVSRQTGAVETHGPGGESILTVTLKNGRQQKLVLNEFVEDGVPMVRVRSVIGPVATLAGDRPVMALRMNATLRYGAFAIEKDNLVLIDTHLMGGHGGCEGRVQSIRYLAEQADKFERLIFGKDQH